MNYFFYRFLRVRCRGPSFTIPLPLFPLTDFFHSLLMVSTRSVVAFALRLATPLFLLNDSFAWSLFLRRSAGLRSCRPPISCFPLPQAPCFPLALTQMYSMVPSLPGCAGRLLHHPGSPPCPWATPLATYLPLPRCEYFRSLDLAHSLCSGDAIVFWMVPFSSPA